MKHFLCLILIIIAFQNLLVAQDLNLARDTFDLPSHSLRVIAEVISADDDMVVLKIENVTGHGRGARTTLSPNDEVTVRLPGKNKPAIKSKIQADLLEKIDVGALPSAYLMLSYKTVD